MSNRKLNKGLPADRKFPKRREWESGLLEAREYHLDGSEK
jgi:hypothetical protein